MWAIARTVLITNLRKSKEILFQAIFPIILMVMLGFIVENLMNYDMSFEDVKVYYVVNNSEAEKTMEIVKENKGNTDIEFIKTDNIEEAKEKVRVNSDVVLLDLKDKDIEIYTNSRQQILGPMISGLLKGVTNRTNAIIASYSIDPIKGNEISKSNIDNNIILDELPKHKSPNSFEYYAVAEIGLMALYLATFFARDIMDEREKKVRERLKLTCIGTKYYAGYTLGALMLSVITSMPAFIFSIVVMKANWGNIFISFLLIMTYNFMVIGIGIFIGNVFDRNSKACSILETTVFTVMGFLGGGYVAIGSEVDGVMGILVNMSHLRWFCQGVFRMGFNNDYSVISVSFIINVLIGAIGIIAAIAMVKRKEARA